ncbi:LOW QUALITY PROTEIN: PQLC2L isoform 2 [Pan troglodytes]|uniref:PQLC2L isoform 2 n=1 Tax=Pan troglodytes TaxID=9598 RepID=A0A2J8P267_PANTR|nr:LOW QUALITY PROTEIN: PQLC2L isoform 2 [Pan troglodytes]
MKVVGNYRVNTANSTTDMSREHLTCLRSQLFVAYRNGRVDEAVLGFLDCWIGGDLTNFKGCYLTNQLPIQIFTAIFNMNTDIIIFSQFMYYRLKNQKKKMIFQPQLFKDSITREKVRLSLWGVLCPVYIPYSFR